MSVADFNHSLLTNADFLMPFALKYELTIDCEPVTTTRPLRSSTVFLASSNASSKLMHERTCLTFMVLSSFAPA